MKIERIKIYGFGKWVDQTFVLPADLAIFYGENEAGKTTLMAFISGVLFGFASKKSKFINTYEPKKQAVYGGELTVNYQGQSYVISRRYRTNTELTVTDLQTHHTLSNPQAFLDKVLGPITAETFQQIYAITTDELAEIRSLTPNEMEQRLLKIGAVGAMEWLQVADKFEKEAQALFAANSKNGKRPLNGLLQQYRRANEQQVELQQQLPTYLASVSSLKGLEQTLMTLKQREGELTGALQDARALAQLEPLYREYKQLIASQKQRVVRINPESKARFEQLQYQKANVIEELSQLEQEHGTELVGEQTTAEISDAIITELQSELGANLELSANYQVLRENVLNSQQRLAQLFDDIGLPEVPTEEQAMTRQVVKTSSNTTKWLIAAGIMGIIILLLPLAGVAKIISLLLIVGWLVYGAWQQQNKSSVVDENMLKRQSLIAEYHREATVLKGYRQQLAQYSHRILGQQQKINRYQLTGVQITEDASQFQRQLQQVSAVLTEQAKIKQNQALGQADIVYQRQYYQQRQQQKQQIERELQTLLTSIGVKDEAEFHLQLVKQGIAVEENQRLTNILQQISPDQLAELERLNGNTAQAVNRIANELAQLDLQQTTLTQQYQDAQIQHLKMVNNGTISEVNQQVANLENEVIADLSTFFVKQLTSQWINEALKQSSQQRMPQIIELATKYFQMLTGGNFVTIDLTSNAITLLTNTHERFTLAELSKGTSEQLYVAFRVAFAQVVTDIIEFPIIIDDGFVNFDEIRLQRMHGLIHEISRQQQVIYLTSNRRAKTDFEVAQLISL